MNELNRRPGGSDDPTPPRDDKSSRDQPGKGNAPDAQPDAGTTRDRTPRPGERPPNETFSSVEEARAALPRDIRKWSPGNPRHVEAMRYIQSAEDARDAQTGAGPGNREQRRYTQPRPPRPESPSTELTGLHARAATDRDDLARHDRPPAGQPDADSDQDGPTGSDDPERGSDDGRTDHSAPPGDRPENDDPKKPADASGGDGRDGDGPKNPSPDDPGPDEGDSPDELAAAKARIAELEKELADARAESDAKLDAANATIADQQKQLEAKDTELKDKDATIGRLQNTCSYLDQKLKAADARSGEQNAKIDALTGKVDELGNMLGDALKHLKSPEQANTDAPHHEAEHSDERPPRLPVDRELDENDERPVPQTDGDPPGGGGDRPPPGSDGDGEGPEPPGSPGDEPGSWRGDSGRYLNFEEHLVTRHNIDRIREIEPRVTDSLRAIESDVPGASMVGFEFRLKGDDRLKDKFAKENRDNPERDLRAIAEDIPDAIRYTYQFDAADYTRGYHDVCAKLESEGYTLVHSANSWDSPDYKGINTRWRTPDGPLFEVQFHTRESFTTKQRTHDLYETVRNPALPREVRAQARTEQRAISAGVPRPAGVETIENFRRQGY